jgi:hypothetical protein
MQAILSKIGHTKWEVTNRRGKVKEESKESEYG